VVDYFHLLFPLSATSDRAVFLLFFFLEINYYLLALNFVSHRFQFFFSIHWTSPWSTGLWLVMTLAGMNEGFSLQQISPGLFAFGVKE
jgi:hypothetical protein